MAYNKDYYEKNKEKISQRNKKYRENNKEKISEYAKNYYKENKDKLNEKSNTYLKEHKELNKINAKLSREKRAENLRKQGILNPYSVINGKPPKYGIKVNNG